MRLLGCLTLLAGFALSGCGPQDEIKTLPPDEEKKVREEYMQKQMEASKKMQQQRQKGRPPGRR